MVYERLAELKAGGVVWNRRWEKVELPLRRTLVRLSNERLGIV